MPPLNQTYYTNSMSLIIRGKIKLPGRRSGKKKDSGPEAETTNPEPPGRTVPQLGELPFYFLVAGKYYFSPVEIHVALK